MNVVAIGHIAFALFWLFTALRFTLDSDEAGFRATVMLLLLCIFAAINLNLAGLI
jgi:hypothetical protein